MTTDVFRTLAPTAWSLAILLAATVPALPATAQSDIDAATVRELVDRTREDGAEAALSTYERLRQRGDADEQALIEAHDVLVTLGLVDEADILIHGLLDLQPDDLTVRLAHARAHWDAGEPGPAAEAYRGVLERDPENLEARSRSEDVFALVGLDLDPHLREALAKGGLEYALARYEELWDGYRYSRMIDFRPHVLNELGLGLADDGRFDAAIAFLHENNRRHQRDPTGELGHAEAHSLQGTMALEIRQAFEATLAAIDQRREAEDRLARRIAELHRSWRLAPDAVEGELLHAEVHVRRGEPALARQVLEAILGAEPDNEEARRKLEALGSARGPERAADAESPLSAAARPDSR